MLVNNLFVSSVNFEMYFTVTCSQLMVTFLLGPAPTLSPFFRLAQAIFEPKLSCTNTPNSQPQSFSIPTRLWRWNRQCSKTLEYKIKMPGNYPEESIQRDIITRIIMTWLLKASSSWSLAVQDAFCILMEPEGPLLCS